MHLNAIIRFLEKIKVIRRLRLRPSNSLKMMNPAETFDTDDGSDKTCDDKYEKLSTNWKKV